MLNTLFLLQYSFLNGYLLHRFFLREKTSTGLEIFLSSLLLSWCLNSMTIYIWVRLFEMPFTKTTTGIVSIILTLTILLIGSLTHPKALKAPKARK